MGKFKGSRVRMLRGEVLRMWVTYWLFERRHRWWGRCWGVMACMCSAVHFCLGAKEDRIVHNNWVPCNSQHRPSLRAYATVRQELKYTFISIQHVHSFQILSTQKYIIANANTRHLGKLYDKKKTKLLLVEMNQFYTRFLDLSTSRCFVGSTLWV